MPGYYIYTIGEDGHIQDRIAVVSDTDEEAKELAKQYVDGRPVELWQGACKVAEFKPEY